MATLDRAICCMTALLWLAITSAAFGATAQLELPLSADRVRQYLVGRHVTTVEGFLAALPEAHKSRFILMRESESRHRATAAFPRVIMFGADARFIVAFSGAGFDPLFDTVEFAEYDEESHAYRFGTIAFRSGNEPKVATDVPLCKGCHDTPTRPIWGTYGDWDGAYGDTGGRIAPEHQSSFAAFVTSAPLNARYRHLRFKAGDRGSSIHLQEPFDESPALDFSLELGNTMAIGAFERMRAHRDYATWRWAALAASPLLNCKDSDSWQRIVPKIRRAAGRPGAETEAHLEAYRLLGIDLAKELPLPGRRRTTDADGKLWQNGEFDVEDALAFQLLFDVMASDATMKRWYQVELPTAAAIRQRMRLADEARAEALRTSTEPRDWYRFYDVTQPAASDAVRRGAVCKYLSDKIPS